MTGVSTWSWMVASLQRYWAVYHPFSTLIRSRRLAPRSILGIFVMSTLLNGWLVLVVDAVENRCTEADFIVNNNGINRSMHAMEIGWSYLIPALLTGVMDVRVFLMLPPGLLTQTVTRNPALCNRSEYQLTSQASLLMVNQTHLRQSYEVRRPQTIVARAAVIRWLLITSVGLLLNAPDNIIRLLALVGLLCEDCAILWNPFESPLAYSIVIIARLLYFAQYSFNAAFLTMVIYRYFHTRHPTTAMNSSVSNIRRSNTSTAL